MAEPGDQEAPGAVGRGRLRASHADRQCVIDTLKAAFVQGRLTKDELDTRADQAFASRTYAELEALTADIPAELAAAQPVGTPARAQARLPAKKVVTAYAVGLFAPTVEVVAFLTNNGLLFAFFLLPTIITFVASVVAGIQIHGSRRQNRSGGQLPPGPPQRGRLLGGQAPEGGLADGPGSDPARCEIRPEPRQCSVTLPWATSRRRVVVTASSMRRSWVTSSRVPV